MQGLVNGGVMPDKGEKTAVQAQGKPWVKLVAVVVALAAVLFIANALGLFDIFKGGTLKDKVERLDTLFRGLGIWAPVVFAVIWIAACVFMLPGLPIAIAGGLVFGALWGTVWSTVGANLGASLAFLIGRYAARDMVSGWIEKNSALRKIDEGVKQQGWRMLMITRLVPIFPFNIQNYVYGLTKISWGTYVLVTLVCMLPGTIAFNFAAGSAREVILSGGQPDAVKKTMLYLGVAAVFFVLLSLVPGWIKKRYGTTVDAGK
jgi:uncharacterized membrane protein YdjX (TVP38/TMEM64 family)